MKKLKKIGENNTRRWSREKPLFWVYDTEECLFPIVISALYFLQNSPKFETRNCSEASLLLEKLCNFKITHCTLIY